MRRLPFGRDERLRPVLYPGALRMLVFILSEADKGRSPSFAEIQRDLGIQSTNGVRDGLARLRKRGMIDFQDGLARTIVPKVRLELVGD